MDLLIVDERCEKIYCFEHWRLNVKLICNSIEIFRNSRKTRKTKWKFEILSIIISKFHIQWKKKNNNNEQLFNSIYKICREVVNIDFCETETLMDRSMMCEKKLSKAKLLRASKSCTRHLIESSSDEGLILSTFPFIILFSIIYLHCRQRLLSTFNIHTAFQSKSSLSDRLGIQLYVVICRVIWNRLTMLRVWKCFIFQASKTDQMTILANEKLWNILTI